MAQSFLRESRPREKLRNTGDKLTHNDREMDGPEPATITALASVKSSDILPVTYFKSDTAAVSTLINSFNLIVTAMLGGVTKITLWR